MLLIYLLLFFEALVDYEPDIYAAPRQRSYEIVLDFLYLCPQLLYLRLKDTLHLLALCQDLSFQDGVGVCEHLYSLDLIT